MALGHTDQAITGALHVSNSDTMGGGRNALPAVRNGLL
jgi:hypothetical protein